MSGEPGPLAGLSIVVTRPKDQAVALGQGIAGAGGNPLYFPLLEISAVDDPEALRQAAQTLPDYALAIFISPNAVNHSLPDLLAASHWPSGLQAAAVGPGTVSALAAFGIPDCIVPTEQFDSEALLALPPLQAAAVGGKRVVIFRGDGGRDLLVDTLRQRGAHVDCVTCYRRSPPAGGFAALDVAWREGRVDALTLSSSEGLRYLLAGLDANSRLRLQETPVFVPHARIAEGARSSGLQQVVLTAPADTGILEGLCAYNWPRS